jgi:pimeloyl-ACP methyl ester carboxylesterase
MRGRWWRSAVAVAGTLGAFALAPSVAGAQGVAAQPCPSPVSAIRGATCGRLQVPLDHLGRVAGVQTLTFARIPARGTSSGTIAFIPGGPGQPALGLADGVVDALRPVLGNHDLLLVDPRGTGLSQPTGCVLTGDPTTARGAAQVAACAARLGPRIGTLTSEQDADDLDAVRATLGIPTLTVLGVSSGTRVAAEYVRRFPAQTDHVVLDSTVSFDGVDALGTLPSLSFPRVLREVCWPPGCAGISHTADPRATVGRLVGRLSRRALRTAIADATGRPQRVPVTLEEFYALLLASDLDPFVRADLPAAIRSANNGDGAYLARDLLIATQGAGGDAVARAAQTRAPSATDSGRFLATTCIEARLPWRPDAPVAGRRQALDAQLQALAPQLAPFPTALVASFSAEPACALWPPVPLPSPVSRTAPAVPTLILSGREDLRSPTEDARREAAFYPNVRLLTVPDVGHSVLSDDLSSCGIRGLAAFLANGPVANCRRGERLIDPAPFIPAHIGSLPAAGAGGLPGRTLTAFGATLADSTRQLLRMLRGGPRRVGGLRRGTLTLSGPRRSPFRAGGLTLRNYETVVGVRVSGTLIASGRLRARFTISGPSAAGGTLTLTSDRITGTLGGRRITIGGIGAGLAAFAP